jgi:hypothetical protein
VFQLFLVFLAFATVISVIQGTVQSGPKNYDMALVVSHMSGGGRYLYPVLLAWFVAGVILLLRELPGEIADSTEEEHIGRIDQPTGKQMT